MGQFTDLAAHLDAAGVYAVAYPVHCGCFKMAFRGAISRFDGLHHLQLSASQLGVCVLQHRDLGHSFYWGSHLSAQSKKATCAWRRIVRVRFLPGLSTTSSASTVPSPDIECAIIGGGPAGLTAALYLARFRRHVTVIDGRQSRAELIPVSHNYPGFPQGISGTELLARLREQAMRYGVPIIDGVVKSLKPVKAEFLLETGGEHVIRAPTVLLATGVNDRKPPIVGIREATLAGAVRWCPICDGFEVQHHAVALLSPAP